MSRATQPVQEALAGVAAGDFTDIADRFSNAGFTVRLPARGILQISAAAQPGQRLCLLLSVGVHGDETAPIEMLAQLLTRLAAEPHTLRVDLLVVVGNPAAVALGRRFVDTDLNRLFERGELAAENTETLRAGVIMRATDGFFAAAGAGRWHLDLHTAIRDSHFPTFAIVPDLGRAADRVAMGRWLGDAGIGAMVLNTLPSGTYSAYTAAQFGAVSCTAELGRVGLLGQNDLSRLAATERALRGLLTGGAVLPGGRPQQFAVAQEVIRTGEGFRLLVEGGTENFTALPRGAVIAEDGERVWRVAAETEFVLFPNPDVAIGRRAALMVVPL